MCSIPGLERSPGEENGNLLQYSHLEKSHGLRHQTGYHPWGLKESDTTEMGFPNYNGLPWWFRWWRICLQCWRPGFWSLGRKDTLGKGMATHSSWQRRTPNSLSNFLRVKVNSWWAVMTPSQAAWLQRSNSWLCCIAHWMYIHQWDPLLPSGVKLQRGLDSPFTC